MKLNEFKEKVVKETRDAIASFNSNDVFVVEFGEFFDEDNGHISASVKITFSFGNCTHSHTVNVGWDEFDGFGIEDVEGEISQLDEVALLKSLYVDLALQGLDDKYLA